MKAFPLALAILFGAGSCGPHASGRFFDPITPGTLVPDFPTAQCPRAYGMRVDAYQPPQQIDPWSSGSSPWENCPNHARLEQIVREEAQSVPLTVAEVASFRLVIVPPEAELWQDGHRSGWITDGYSVEAHYWAIRPALSVAFRRAALLRGTPP